SGSGLALVLYALSQGPQHGWASAPVLATLLAGLACFAVLVPLELRVHDPMLRLALLRDRLFASCNLTGAFGFAAFLGILFVLPLFLQEGRGASALVSGLTTFPEAVGVIAASQLIARLYPRVGPRRLMAGGLAGVTVAMLLLTQVGSTTDLWLVRLIMFAMGAAMANVFMSLQTATFARISRADTGQGSAIFNTQRQVASALGVAILATVLTGFGHGSATGTGHGGGPVDLAGFHAAFVAAAALALAGAVVALSVHDEDAVATMHRRGAPPVPAADDLPSS
ncbi:MAG TPA: MFS transporter, partial [Acidimicrobiales bacterium]|nr:MFS transporter [Acidimicrobiales bacterium]